MKAKEIMKVIGGIPSTMVPQHADIVQDFVKSCKNREKITDDALRQAWQFYLLGSLRERLKSL